MLKKSLPFACAGLMLVCVLVLTSQRQRKVDGTRSTHASLRGQLLADETVDHVPYMFLFRHLAHLNAQAEKQRQAGKNGAGFRRRFAKRLLIDDDQFEVLNEIALSCEQEVTKLDKQAAAIIKSFRARYPEGEVPEGVVIPPPPVELIKLQEARNKAILRARDRVKEALGEREFARFDEILKLRLTPDIKRTSPPPPAS